MRIAGGRMGLALLAAASVASVLLLAGCGGGGKAAEVDVALREFSVSPSVTKAAPGSIRFQAHNQGTMIHELAVISIDEKGQKHEVAEVEEVGPGQSASFVAGLKPGRYELACLVAPGEAGSTVDHYQQGMHTSFIVE